MLSSPSVYLDFISREAKRTVYNNPLLVNAMSKELEIRNPGRMPILAAKALSSVGFALSVFAIWLDWVCPVAKHPLPELRFRHSTRDKSRRRRSAPASFGTATQRRSRRQKPLPTRSNTSPQLPGATPEDATARAASSSQQPQQVVLLDTDTPAKQPDPGSRGSISSSYTLPTTPPQHKAFAQIHLDTCDESVESDGSHVSSRPSVTSTSARLARMKLFMGKTRKRSLSTAPTNPVPEVMTDGIEKPLRKPTSGFVPPWAASRPSPTSETATDSTGDKPSTPHRSFFTRRPLSARPTTSPSATVSTSPERPARPTTPTPSSATTVCFTRTRKSDRRRSAPIPRTQPYDYPYFAAMPTPLDDQSFVEEPAAVDEFGQRSDRNVAQTHAGVLRQTNANLHSQLGHGRPSSNGRTASETFTQRRSSLQS